MKRKNHSYSLVALCLPLSLTIAQAQIVVQHLGADDPLAEGFELSLLSPNTEVSPVFNDLGRDAWMIKLNSVEDRIQYTHSLTQQQGENAMTYGWELSTTVRFLAMPPSTGQARLRPIDRAGKTLGRWSSHGRGVSP